MASFGSAVAGNGLPVSDSRNLGCRLDAVLALELLEDDVQVDVAQPCDDQLLGLFDALHVQRRILFAQAGQAAGDLFLVTAGLRGDGQAVRGSRKVEWWERPSVLHPERVARKRVGELG